jgi:hypothetical protein
MVLQSVRQQTTKAGVSPHLFPACPQLHLHFHCFIHVFFCGSIARHCDSIIGFYIPHFVLTLALFLVMHDSEKSNKTRKKRKRRGKKVGSDPNHKGACCQDPFQMSSIALSPAVFVFFCVV